MDKEKVGAAFNEWMRRYIENPEEFARQFQSVGAFLSEKNKGVEPSYGEICAEYLDSLMVAI
jgi:hypothetical protein